MAGNKKGPSGGPSRKGGLTRATRGSASRVSGLSVTGGGGGGSRSSPLNILGGTGPGLQISSLLSSNRGSPTSLGAVTVKKTGWFN